MTDDNKPDSTTNGTTPEHDTPERKKRGRPNGIINKGLEAPLPFKTEIKNGVSYYHAYVPRKTKEGKILYYRHTTTYEQVIDRKKRAVYGNPNYTQKKKQKTHTIKKALNDNMNKLTLEDLDTLARIFTECDLTLVKNNIIRLHKEDLTTPAITAT